MQSAKNMDHGEAPAECLLLETTEARVVDAVEGAVFKQAELWFVIGAHDKAAMRTGGSTGAVLLQENVPQSSCVSSSQ